MNKNNYFYQIVNISEGEFLIWITCFSLFFVFLGIFFEKKKKNLTGLSFTSFGFWSFSELITSWIKTPHNTVYYKIYNTIYIKTNNFWTLFELNLNDFLIPLTEKKKYYEEFGIDNFLFYYDWNNEISRKLIFAWITFIPAMIILNFSIRFLFLILCTSFCLYTFDFFVYEYYSEFMPGEIYINFFNKFYIVKPYTYQDKLDMFNEVLTKELKKDLDCISEKNIYTIIKNYDDLVIIREDLKHRIKEDIIYFFKKNIIENKITILDSILNTLEEEENAFYQNIVNFYENLDLKTIIWATVFISISIISAFLLYKLAIKMTTKENLDLNTNNVKPLENSVDIKEAEIISHTIKEEINPNSTSLKEEASKHIKQVQVFLNNNDEFDEGIRIIEESFILFERNSSMLTREEKILITEMYQKAIINIDKKNNVLTYNVIDENFIFKNYVTIISNYAESCKYPDKTINAISHYISMDEKNISLIMDFFITMMNATP